MDLPNRSHLSAHTLSLPAGLWPAEVAVCRRGPSRSYNSESGIWISEVNVVDTHATTLFCAKWSLNAVLVVEL